LSERKALLCEDGALLSLDSALLSEDRALLSEHGVLLSAVYEKARALGECAARWIYCSFVLAKWSSC